LFPNQGGRHAIQTGTLYYGWDTTPDIKAPALPADVKVKDIHDDGFAFKRNIITWARIPNPDRNGVNDFKEYKIYRSDDGVTWQQICQNGTNNILRNACDAQYPNPLYNANQNIGMATNYYMDLIPIASADQYYYYHVTAIDNAKDGFKYFDNTVINNYSNESAPEIGSNGAIVSVSLNPAIAKPSICNVGSNPCTSTAGATKAVLAEVGVASATITWNTDQPTDSIVEFKRAGTSDAYIGTIDRAKGTSHTVTIKPLVPNTNYDYRVVSRNSLANDATAEGSEVPTLTTTGFNITPGAVVTTTSTTEVNWTTNLDAASAIVEYQLQRQPGDDAQSGVAGASAESLAATPRSHKVIIKGLRSNRTYTYKIKSISKDNFLAEYPQGQFSTFKTKSYDSEQFTLAPSSSNVAERNITSTTAQIVWQTGSPTTSWVDYGTKPGIYDVSSGDNNLTTTHVVVLNGLVPGTKYYYRVRVKDTNEVEFNSQEYTFTAVLKPKITGLTISNVTPYAITISWSTNVETETLMNWGTTTAYGAKRGNAQISTQHSVTIDNLEDNTEYHYQILAHDQAGNEVADDDKVVRTPLDTAGPKISDVKNDILLNEANNTAQVIISWKTDKPATTFVQYDEGVIGGKYTKASVEDTGLSNAHTVIIKDLDPGVAYHYRIITKDKRGNETISNDYNFITPAAEKSILQLILKSLEETFSWVGNVGKYFSSLGKKTK
jgi:phosphodiesterase/alkaline phosphatase D-like protein